MLRFFLVCACIAALVGCGGSGGGSNGLAGHIYIADGNPRVVRLNGMSGAGWVAHPGDSGTPFNDYIGDVEFDSSGNMYVSDPQNSRIWKFSSFSDTTGESFGTNGSGVNQFGNSGLNLAIDAQDRIYVCDTDNDRIVRIDDITGTDWITFGSTGSGNSQFDFPTAIDVDTSGKIYVGDIINDRIARIDDMAGNGWTTFGSTGFGVGQFEGISDLLVLANGKMLIADRGGRVIMTSNMSATNWVSFNENTVQGVAMDSLGRIYTVNQFDDVVRRYNSMTDASPVTFGSNGSGTNEFSSASSITIGP